MKHIVTIQSEKRGLGSTPALRKLIKEAIRTALQYENVDFLCSVSVMLTDDEGILVINSQTRGIDSATDVLSFPMLDWYDGNGDEPGEDAVDFENGSVFLGDMVLNVDRIRQQGEEFGHGFDRECAYLTVHSILHLLGYDHVDDEARKAVMRRKEEEIMSRLGLKCD